MVPIVANNSENCSSNNEIFPDVFGEIPYGDELSYDELDDEDYYFQRTKSNEDISIISVADQIRIMAIKHNASHALINDLLQIFNTNDLSSIKLPKDSRTLLKTPRLVKIDDLGDGHFWYNGIESSLRGIFHT